MALQHGQRYLGRGVDLAALEAAQAALKLTDSDCMELHRTIQVDLKAATLIVG